MFKRFFLKNRNPNRYFEIIENSPAIANDDFDAIEERQNTLEKAFTELENYTSQEVEEKLANYVYDAKNVKQKTHIYPNEGFGSSEHFLALRTLGHVGSEKYASLIIEELDSELRDIPYIALSALGDMYRRGVLTRKNRVFAREKFIAIIYNDKSANEDVIECVSALKESKNLSAKEAIDYAISNRLEIEMELKEILS